MSPSRLSVVTRPRSDRRDPATRVEHVEKILAFTESIAATLRAIFDFMVGEALVEKSERAYHALCEWLGDLRRREHGLP
jgi:hypothetical protein